MLHALDVLMTQDDAAAHAAAEATIAYATFYHTTPWVTMGVLPSIQSVATLGSSLLCLPLIWLARGVYLLVGAAEGWGMLTIPYHTIPYHTIPYRTIPYRTIPFDTIRYDTIPYHTKPHHITPCHTLPYHTVPCHTWETDWVCVYGAVRGALHLPAVVNVNEIIPGLGEARGNQCIGHGTHLALVDVAVEAIPVESRQRVPGLYI